MEPEVSESQRGRLLCSCRQAQRKTSRTTVSASNDVKTLWRGWERRKRCRATGMAKTALCHVWWTAPASPNKLTSSPSPFPSVLAEHTWSETLQWCADFAPLLTKFPKMCPGEQMFSKALTYQHCVSVTVPPETPSESLRLDPKIELESCSELEEKWKNHSSEKFFSETFWPHSYGRVGDYQTFLKNLSSRFISLHLELSSFSLDALIFSSISSLIFSFVFRLLSFCPSQFDLLLSLFPAFLSFIFSLLSSLLPFIFLLSCLSSSSLHFSSCLSLFLSLILSLSHCHSRLRVLLWWLLPCCVVYVVVLWQAENPVDAGVVPVHTGTFWTYTRDKGCKMGGGELHRDTPTHTNTHQHSRIAHLQHTQRTTHTTHNRQSSPFLLKIYPR